MQHIIKRWYWDQVLASFNFEFGIVFQGEQGQTKTIVLLK